MNVLYLTGYSIMGGAETHILSLLGHGSNEINKFFACIVRPEIHRVEILERAMDLGIPSQCVISPGRFHLKTLDSIRSIISSRNIHVIHCHGYKADIFGLLAARLCKKRVVTTLHGWTDATASLRLYKIFDLTIVRFFDKVICVSPQLVKQTARWRIPGSMVAMVYNGIDKAKFNVDLDEHGRQVLRRELGIRNGSPVVGTVGRLSIEKGHRYLLQAAVEIRREVPNVTLLIVGDGPLRKELAGRVKELDLERNVIFTGYRTDIPQVLSIIDVFAQPSEREGLPISILEASMMRSPIVASDVGAVSAVIIDGRTGILVRPGDECGLAEAILLLLKNPDRARLMGNAAKSFVESNFSSESMVAKVDDIYREVLKKDY